MNPNTISDLRNEVFKTEFTLAQKLNKLFTDEIALNKPSQELARLALRLLYNLDTVLKRKNPTLDTEKQKARDAVLEVYKAESHLSIFLESFINGQPNNKGKFKFQGSNENDRKLDVETSGSLYIKTLYQLTTKKENPVLLSIVHVGEIIRLFAGVLEGLYNDAEGRRYNDRGEEFIQYIDCLRIVGIDKDLMGSIADLKIEEDSEIKPGLKVKKVNEDQPEPKTEKDSETLLKYFPLKAFCELRESYRTTHWGNIAFDQRFRKRKKTGNSIGESGLSKDIIDIIDNKESLKPWNHSLTSASKTGISINELQAGSIIKYIDDKFLLPYGADVSGTTADTIWAIEVLANLLFGKNAGKKVEKDHSGWDENLLLLPIASIVYGYHHTILETAVALNINGYGNYTPGLYTTLQSDTMLGSSPIGGKINELLEKRESEYCKIQDLKSPEAKAVFRVKYTSYNEYVIAASMYSV